jgi:hypothetical protein
LGCGSRKEQDVIFANLIAVVVLIITPFFIINAKKPRLKLFSAAEKRFQWEPAPYGDYWGLYTTPGMDDVMVGSIIWKSREEGLNGNKPIMDIYYPPDFIFRTPLPVVVFGGCGNRNFKDVIDACQYIAASGLIVVTYDETTNCDIHGLIHFIQRHARVLGIDKRRIGLFGWEHVRSHTGGHVSNSPLDALLDTRREYHEDLKCAVFLRPMLFSRDMETSFTIPTLLVLSGNEYFADRNDSSGSYIENTHEKKLPLNTVVFNGADPRFTYRREIAGTHEIFRFMIEFWKSHMLV